MKFVLMRGGGCKGAVMEETSAVDAGRKEGDGWLRKDVGALK